MSIKKIQFFVDTPLQSNFCEHQVLIKPPIIDHSSKEYFESIDINEYMVCFDEYKINTNNSFLLEFCKTNFIEQNLYYKILRLFQEITLINCSFKRIDELPSKVIHLDPKIRSSSYIINKINLNQPCIVKVFNNEYFVWDKLINYKKDIIVSNNILSQTKTEMRYRIYINDRMLIERFFPEDLPTSKIICENCFLDIKQPITAKLVTNHNLSFTKISSDDVIVYPNSTEFILEP
jgi:hypothetical protein